MGYSKEYLKFIGNKTIKPEFSFKALFKTMAASQIKPLICEGFGNIGYAKLANNQEVLAFYVLTIGLKSSFLYFHPLEDIIKGNQNDPLFGEPVKFN